jgi:hypothetical protein
LYACDTQSLTLREETELQVFDDKVLKKISEPEKDDVNKQLRIYITRNYMIYSPNIIMVKYRWLRGVGMGG